MAIYPKLIVPLQIDLAMEPDGDCSAVAAKPSPAIGRSCC